MSGKCYLNTSSSLSVLLNVIVVVFLKIFTQNPFSGSVIERAIHRLLEN